MVDDPEKEAEAPSRADDLALDLRMKHLMETAKVMKWDATKTAAVEEYLRERLRQMTDSQRAYFPEWRLVPLIEEAGRDFDSSLARQDGQS